MLRHHLPLAPVLCAVSLVALVACGDDGGTGGAGTGGSGTGGQTSSSSAGGGGAGGGTQPFVPTPADVQFRAVNPLPAGEQILLGDWEAAPNELLSMRPDGSELTPIFESFRVWSMGVSNDASTIAFAAGDPEQEAHYGPLFGDSIQPTFLYDVATETAEVLSYGNLNDECHAFSPDDAHLYVCRRYDFDAEGVSTGYRIGRVELASKSFEWLTDEVPQLFTLSPQPLAGGTELVYAKVPVPGTRTIVRRAIAGGAETILRSNAGNPVLAPDGQGLLVSDYTQQGSLVLVREGLADVLVAQGPDITNARFSPDGTRVAFLRWEGSLQCSHVEIAAVDGSQASSPERIYDCATEGRFLSDLAWITR
mgnify:CR=1 FL=1